MDLSVGMDSVGRRLDALATVCCGIVVILTAFASSVRADETAVDIELVLAVDISASISVDEQQLQRQGYVQAFHSAPLIQAILAGRLGRVAIAYVEWANPAVQSVVIPWRLVDGADAANRFAAELARAPFRREFDTSIANALIFSSRLLADNRYSGERKVIDISANGPNNTGPPVLPARSAVIDLGITINGLPIMTKMSWGGGLYSIEGLDLYFEDCVIGGDGAFMEVVKRKEDFASAIERKLVLEIAWQDNAFTPAVLKLGARVDCLAGEKNSGRLLPPK